MTLRPFFRLVPTQAIQTEAALLQIAAYLWECEEIILAELEKMSVIIPTALAPKQTLRWLLNELWLKLAKETQQ